MQHHLKLGSALATLVSVLLAVCAVVLGLIYRRYLELSGVNALPWFEISKVQAEKIGMRLVQFDAAIRCPVKIWI